MLSQVKMLRAFREARAYEEEGEVRDFQSARHMSKCFYFAIEC